MPNNKFNKTSGAVNGYFLRFNNVADLRSAKKYIRENFKSDGVTIDGQSTKDRLYLAVSAPAKKGSMKSTFESVPGVSRVDDPLTAPNLF